MCVGKVMCVESYAAQLQFIFNVLMRHFAHQSNVLYAMNLAYERLAYERLRKPRHSFWFV